MVLENLNAWWKTPQTAAEAVALRSTAACADHVRKWMTVLDQGEGAG